MPTFVSFELFTYVLLWNFYISDKLYIHNNIVRRDKKKINVTNLFLDRTYRVSLRLDFDFVCYTLFWVLKHYKTQLLLNICVRTYDSKEFNDITVIQMHKKIVYNMYFLSSKK